MHGYSRYFLFRHSHGSTGCGSAHNPFLVSRASFSNRSSSVSSGAYFRYHQHQFKSWRHNVRVSV